jgi:hypothetical protein
MQVGQKKNDEPGEAPAEIPKLTTGHVGYEREFQGESILLNYTYQGRSYEPMRSVGGSPPHANSVD